MISYSCENKKNKKKEEKMLKNCCRGPLSLHRSTESALHVNFFFLIWICIPHAHGLNNGFHCSINYLHRLEREVVFPSHTSWAVHKKWSCLIAIIVLAMWQQQQEGADFAASWHTLHTHILIYNKMQIYYFSLIFEGADYVNVVVKIGSEQM
jgi:hypothetical protein